MTNKAKSKKKSTLTQGQSYQLMKWLDEHREELQGASLTKEDVARRAQKDLRFLLTWSNMRTALKTVGINLATERGPGTGGTGLNTRLTRLEQGFERLCRKLGSDPADLLDGTESLPFGGPKAAPDA
jgi:hypothetical protein